VGAGEPFNGAILLLAFPIRQAVPVGLAWAHFAPGLVGLDFSRLKLCIAVDTTYLHTIYCFINLWVGENGWMA